MWARYDRIRFLREAVTVGFPFVSRLLPMLADRQSNHPTLFVIGTPRVAYQDNRRDGSEIRGSSSTLKVVILSRVEQLNDRCVQELEDLLHPATPFRAFNTGLGVQGREFSVCSRQTCPNFPTIGYFSVLLALPEPSLSSMSSSSYPGNPLPERNPVASQLQLYRSPKCPTMDSFEHNGSELCQASGLLVPLHALEACTIP